MSEVKKQVEAIDIHQQADDHGDRHIPKPCRKDGDWFLVRGLIGKPWNREQT
jgi:hypothetical protein